MRSLRARLALFCWLLSPAPVLAAPDRCEVSPSANKAVVLQFYALAFEQLKVRKAFQLYADPRFVEHSEDTPGGTLAGTIEFLEKLIARCPRSRWEVVRSAADGDIVFLHVRFTPEPGKAATAIAEVFRLRKCRLVGHWDVIAHAPDKPVNPNSRF